MTRTLFHGNLLNGNDGMIDETGNNDLQGRFSTASCSGAQKRNTAVLEKIITEKMKVSLF